MDKKEFKDRWESNDGGGGITFDDIAVHYVSWGLGSAPRTKPIGDVQFAVLKAAATIDANDYAPKHEGAVIGEQK